MKQKKIPMRMCIGCRRMKPKRELVRLVRDADGNVFVDKTSKAPGRGAYLCKNAACLRKAAKSHRIDRVLECTIPDAVYEEMAREIDGNGNA